MIHESTSLFSFAPNLVLLWSYPASARRPQAGVPSRRGLDGVEVAPTARRPLLEPERFARALVAKSVLSKSIAMWWRGCPR
jgi:hypothetical protein